MNAALYDKHIYNAKSPVPAGYHDGGVVKPEGIGKLVAEKSIASAAIKAQADARQGQLMKI